MARRSPGIARIGVALMGAMGLLSASPATATEPAYDRPDIEGPESPPPAERDVVDAPANEGEVPTVDAEAGELPTFETPSGARPEGPREADEPRARPNGLMIGGYVTAGLAVAALGPLIAGVVMSSQGAEDFPDGRTPAQIDEDRRRTRNGNRLAAAGGIAAGALGITAVVLVATGKAKRDAQAVSVAPTVELTRAGFSLSGRF